MQGQQGELPKIKLIPIGSKPSVKLKSKPTEIVLAKPKKAKTPTRIEKYNVDELCWQLHMNVSRDQQDIAGILNRHLEAKRIVLLREGMIDPDFTYPTLTRMDVRLYLERQSEKIEEYLGKQRRRMMEASFDVIKNIQDLAVGAQETMEVWYTKFAEALNKDDIRELTRATNMLHRERSQIQGFMEKLAILLGKVKTYISVDTMQQQVFTIADMIESEDEIEDGVKIHLLQRIIQTMEITAFTKVE